MNATIKVKDRERAVSTWRLVTGCWNQAMVDWSDHKRARNWTATVWCDKASPGGLGRRFWAHGSSSWVRPDCRMGDYIEVASDYYSGSGSKRAGRRYFRVLDVAADAIVVREASTPGATPPDVETERILAGIIPALEPEPTNPLADFSDEEILAEVARRGLLAQPVESIASQ